MRVSSGSSSPDLSSLWMARALGVLYAGGGTLAVVWTLLPHRPVGDDRVVLAMAILAVALGGLLTFGPRTAPPRWVLHVVLAVIQLVISTAYVAIGTPDNDVRLFYAWATPYAAFFFGRRAAVLHSVWTAVCLATSMDLTSGPVADKVRVWLITMGTVAAVGILVGIVAGRMRRVQRQLHEAAVRDPLTGLCNRRGFATALGDALDGLARDGGAVVVVLVDLDHFKHVNDSYGHQVGDQVLVEVAPRLTRAVRPVDVVARMGGDEFAVVCRDLDGDLDVDALVARLQRCWREPVEAEPGTLTVSGSAGAVRTDRTEDTAESLLRDADIALYRAKNNQRGTAVVYQESLRDELDREIALEHGLRGALRHEELSLAFQAVVDVDTGRVDGAEALLRWTSGDLGPVPPADFIPIAEDRGLVVEIGTWVIEEVCATLAGWRASDLVDDDFTVAVNVSGRQLQPGFSVIVSAALDRHGLPPRVLHLEITESVLLDDTPSTRACLDDLCRLGTPVLLDDFGTGYSSLSYLDRLPLSGLKIDKSFVDHLNGSPRHQTLVAAILAMAEGLDMTVVAEGVETEEVARVLRSLGCRHAQGFWWARPEDTAGFARRMRAAPAVSRS